MKIASIYSFSDAWNLYDLFSLTQAVESDFNKTCTEVINPVRLLCEVNAFSSSCLQKIKSMTSVIIIKFKQCEKNYYNAVH